MDSFYDAPRRPPAPLSREMLNAVPVVPEISVLCSSKAPQNVFTPYSQWKQQHHTSPRNFLEPNKENVHVYPQNLHNNSILKKQVRFENPGFQSEAKKPDFPENIGKPLVNNVNHDNVPLKNNQGGIPNFEQMYMANIPNRQLDLSVIDLPKRIRETKISNQADNIKNSSFQIKNKEKKAPKNYKEFLESQKGINGVTLNDSVTDIFNYKGNIISEDCHSLKKTQFSNIHETKKPDMLNKPDKYFHSVSELIAQRTLNQPLDMNHYDAGKLESVVGNVTDHIGDQNKLFTFAMQERKEGNYVPIENTPRQENLNAKVISQLQKKCECCLGNTENNELKLRSEDDFSTKDLLKIIAQQSQQITQQNNHLLLLQQQVTELITTQKNFEYTKRKGIDCCPNERDYLKNNIRPILENNALDKCSIGQNMECVTSTQHEVANGEQVKNKNQLPNFSIGLTTSFEVSFRKPTHRGEAFQKNTKLLDFVPEPPRIQEITETESTRTEKEYSNRVGNELVDASMVFKEPIQVKESCPSPEPSIKINMNDFDDSDSDDESTNVEASFYRNLMAQVNKILQKAQIETTDEMTCNIAGPSLNNKTMHKVKEATLKHLRKIGVNLPNIEENHHSSSADDAAGKSYEQEDISFAVKQLLLKYLPADHLAKLAAKKAQTENFLSPREKIGAIKNRPEFSFATVQYMKKYNLIANNQKDINKCYTQNPSLSPKILDISKLKQQPKLL